MHIIPDPTRSPEHPAPESAPALSIVPAELGDLVARLRGSVLFVDTASPAEDQLAAIADAVEFLRTGRMQHGRRVRHLRAVTA